MFSFVPGVVSEGSDHICKSDDPSALPSATSAEVELVHWKQWYFFFLFWFVFVFSPSYAHAYMDVLSLNSLIRKTGTMTSGMSGRRA